MEKIVALGAAGRTGRLVVEQALTRGDEVVDYARNPHGIAANPGLEIAVGQSGDMLALKAAINGADAVLVCLGTHGKRMKKNVDLMQKSVPSIIKLRIAPAPLRCVQFADAAADSLARDAMGSTASTQPPPRAL
jgi:putative NADH-flavin reductase